MSNKEEALASAKAETERKLRLLREVAVREPTNPPTDEIERVARAMVEVVPKLAGQASISAATAALAAMDPEIARLREQVAARDAAIVALADGADKCSEAPHFIVQPFLDIFKKHGETIAAARAALTTPEGGG